MTSARAAALARPLTPSGHDEPPEYDAYDARDTHDARFVLTSLLEGPGPDMAADVLAGFIHRPKSLPPKYFYDERGSRLFDAICHTDEYYPTRTEQALLERVAGTIVAESRPSRLVELGSGAARKTRVLLDRLVAQHDAPWYVPVDISEQMLRHSSSALLRDYPSLRVHGVVADYERHLHSLPSGGRRLIAFLGSTVGNFDQPTALAFIRSIATGMRSGDRLLLGLDLVKSPAVLHAAYNDAAGITAAFNRNVLHVLNRELGASFDPDAFEHIATYRPELQQIEMYLAARRGQRVFIRELGRNVVFAAGERMRTEISRKFTRASATNLICGAGLAMRSWYPSADGYFALAVAALAGPS